MWRGPDMMILGSYHWLKNWPMQSTSRVGWLVLVPGAGIYLLHLFRRSSTSPPTSQSVQLNLCQLWMESDTPQYMSHFLSFCIFCSLSDRNPVSDKDNKVIFRLVSPQCAPIQKVHKPYRQTHTPSPLRIMMIFLLRHSLESAAGEWGRRVERCVRVVKRFAYDTDLGHRTLSKD